MYPPVAQGAYTPVRLVNEHGLQLAALGEVGDRTLGEPPLNSSPRTPMRRSP